MNSIEKKTIMLLGVFISALLLANLLGTKITTIFGINVSVGIFAYPMTFVCTDIIAEVRGEKVTRQFVKVGLIALFLTIILVAIALYLPPSSRYPYNDEFTLVFQTSFRMIIASMISFAISQYHDIWAFSLIKEKTRGRFLWLRNNISTIFSQLIDTTIFMFLAFYKVAPKFTAGFIVSLIIPYWLFKIIFALADTPFVYLGVKWLRK